MLNGREDRERSPRRTHANGCANRSDLSDLGLKVPQVVLPRKGLDLTKWCVIACDQYTSQPQYWESVKNFVKDEPSTLNLIFPEVYLGDAKTNQKIIRGINDKMCEYERDRVLEALDPGFVLIDRQTPHVARLLVALDLELYSFEKNSQSLIRPTEKTIPERLPPRIAIREQSPLELPHILVLIDDPSKTVIEPLAARSANEDIQSVAEALRALACPETFRKKYGAREDQGVILYPVGDGNHSLATAKRCWESLKQQGAGPNHPARHALVELVNIHDPGMTMEPIHRLLFNVDVQKALEDFQCDMKKRNWEVQVRPGHTLQGTKEPGIHAIEFRSKNFSGILAVKSDLILEVATLTAWLDPYLAAHSEISVDYVHGEEVIAEKTSGDEKTLAFLFPIMDKNDLVRTVVREGVLPRKTFSMGAADEKRFYFECQRIVPEATEKHVGA
eukprot:Skav205865  [mRNA]  locus=scaffold766:160519:163899:+ [translate_table: standard]